MRNFNEISIKEFFPLFGFESHWICIWWIIGKCLTFIPRPFWELQMKKTIRSESPLLILSLEQSVSLVHFSMNTWMSRSRTEKNSEQNICFTCSGDLCLDFHLVRADDQQTTRWCNIIIFIQQTLHFSTCTVSRKFVL